MIERAIRIIEEICLVHQPLRTLESRFGHALGRKLHFRSVVYSILIACHVVWISQAYYSITDMFSAGMVILTLSEYCIVLCCRVIVLLLQVCGTVYFIDKLLGGMGTGVIEEVVWNFSFLKAWNSILMAFMSALRIVFSALHLSPADVLSGSLALLTNSLWICVSILICDVFLAWGPGAAPPSNA